MLTPGSLGCCEPRACFGKHSPSLGCFCFCFSDFSCDSEDTASLLFSPAPTQCSEGRGCGWGKPGEASKHPSWDLSPGLGGALCLPPAASLWRGRREYPAPPCFQGDGTHMRNSVESCCLPPRPPSQLGTGPSQPATVQAGVPARMGHHGISSCRDALVLPAILRKLPLHSLAKSNPVTS